MKSEVFINTTYKPSFTFAIEDNYDAEVFRQWMEDHWTQSFWLCAFYLIFIYIGTGYMKHRPAFDLRLPLTLWSAGLAALSFVGAVRTLPEMAFTLREHGFERSVCDSSFFHGYEGIWCCLFCLSKAYELGDTVFIVLRKSPLILLHWYHHTTVLIYVWYGFDNHTSMGRWSMCMNYSVHAIMYSYYTLKAMRIRVPKWVNLLITTTQIAQMVMGLVINYTSYQVKQRGEPCQQTYWNIFWAVMMYLSYFVLFVEFFSRTYVRKPKPVVKATNGVKTESPVANGNGYHHANNNNKKEL